MTSVIHTDFNHSFTVTSRNLWHVKVKFFHPPHLCCVTTLPRKQTLLLISVLSVYTSVATSWCRSEYFVWGRRGWSSSILERKLTVHTTAISSSRRVCCLTSEQYVVITGRHCSRMERQRTSPGPRWKKSTSTPLNLTCGLQIALILIPLFGVLFSNESTTNDNSSRWNNWSERYSPSGKNSHSVSLITLVR